MPVGLGLRLASQTRSYRVQCVESWSTHHVPCSMWVGHVQVVGTLQCSQPYWGYLLARFAPQVLVSLVHAVLKSNIIDISPFTSCLLYSGTSP